LFPRCFEHPSPRPNCESCIADGGSWSDASQSCSFTTTNDAGSVFFSAYLGQARFDRKTNYFRNARVAGKNIDLPAIATHTWNFQSLNRFYLQAPLTTMRPFKIWVARESIDSAIYSPTVLKYDRETLAETITDDGTPTGILRQVLSHDRFTDIQALTTTLINSSSFPSDLKTEVNNGSGDGFLIRTWVAGEQGAKSGDFYALPTAAPLSYLLFYNPDPSPALDSLAIIHRYLADESGSGTYKTESNIHTSSTLGGNDFWTLTRHDGLPATATIEKTTLNITKTNALKFTRVREVQQISLSATGIPGTLGVVSRISEEFDNVGGLSRLVKQIDGYQTTAPRTTLYGWYSNPANTHEFGKMRYVRYHDRSYRYYAYTFNDFTNIATITISTPWKDNLWNPGTTPPATSQCLRTVHTIGADTLESIRYQGSTMIARTNESWATTGSELIHTSQERYTTTAKLTTTTGYHLSTAASHLAGRIKWREFADGTAETYDYTTPNGNGTYTQTVDRGAGDRSDITAGTRTIHVREARGNITSETVQEFDSTTSLTMNSWAATYSGRLNRPTERTFNGNANDKEQYSYDYNCCGGPASTVRNRRGTTIETQSDLLKRTFKRTVTTGTLSRSTTTSYSFAGGNLIQETKHFGGTLVSKTTRHLNGETLSVGQPDQNNDATPELTTYAYLYPTGGGGQVTITYPDLSTEITTTFVDGRTKSRTGTAVADTTYDYEIHSEISGNGIKSKVIPDNPNEAVTSYYDCAGRLFRTEFTSEIDNPGTIDTPGTKDRSRQTYYSHTDAPGSRGKVHYSYDPDNVAQRFSYDSQGRLSKTEKAVPTSPITVLAQLTSYSFTTDLDLGGPCLVTTSSLDDGTTTVELSKSLRSGDGYGSRQIQFDDATNLTTTTVRSKPTATTPYDWDETTTHPDGTISKTIYNLNELRERTNYKTDGITVIDEQTYYYDSPDGLGRLTSSVHSRTGTATYDSNTASGNLLQATAPGSRVTSYGYDVMGRPITVDAPDIPNAAVGQLDYTNITRTAYTDRGEVRATWGGQTYPKRYQYDAQGRMTHLHTTPTTPRTPPTSPTPTTPSGA